MNDTFKFDAMSDADHEHDQDFIPMTIPFQIASGILIVCLTLFSIGGNLLTVIAYVTDRKLCSVYDFYIFNLAVTDLCIGCVSMPFYAVYTLEEFHWEFGVVFCKIWLVVDFTLCLESIVLMLMLSMDRLALVTLGPYYTTTCTICKSKLHVTISWFVSFALYGPAIICWDFWVGYSTVDISDCDVEFSYSFEFTTVTAVAEFIVPVIGLAIINAKIYQKIKSRGKLTKSSTYLRVAVTNASNNVDVRNSKLECQQNRQKSVDSSNTFATNSSYQQRGSSRCVQNDAVTNGDNHVTFVANQSNSTHDGQSGPINVNSRFSINSYNNSQTNPENSNISSSEQKVQTPIATKVTESSIDLSITMAKNKEHSRLKRDRKAARFLAILVIVFMVCWAPYTITTMIISFCQFECVNTSVYEAMNWLLWAKSAINPFLFAMNSVRYRYNFKKYLYWWKRSVYPTETEATGQTTGQY